MTGSFVALSIKLEAATRQEGNVWLACCPQLDVVTQADTKRAALESLREAVELWFESCIARNVLDQALREVGFVKMKPGEAFPKNASVVKVHEPKHLSSREIAAKPDYIEVSIPAYIAAHCTVDSSCAPC